MSPITMINKTILLLKINILIMKKKWCAFPIETILKVRDVTVHPDTHKKITHSAQNQYILMTNFYSYIFIIFYYRGTLEKNKNKFVNLRHVVIEKRVTPGLSRWTSDLGKRHDKQNIILTFQYKRGFSKSCKKTEDNTWKQTRKQHPYNKYRIGITWLTHSAISQWYDFKTI